MSPANPYPRKSSGRGRRKGTKNSKVHRPKPHDVSLADLFLWITVTDACLDHPIGAFRRAAAIADLTDAEVVQCVDRLEVFLKTALNESGQKRFHRLMIKRRLTDMRDVSKKRNGMLYSYGAFFAEVCALIEHLWLFAIDADGFRSKDVDILRHLGKAIYDVLPLAETQPCRMALRRDWHNRVFRQSSGRGVPLAGLARLRPYSSKRQKARHLRYPKSPSPPET